MSSCVKTILVMDSEYYNSKLSEIVSDVTKFETCPQNQTKITKDAINRAIADIKVSQPDVHKQLKITGDFYNGHLYGLPKIYKNATAPPLRPIINMSVTVTHELAQYLNKQIRPYIDRSHMISSSDELLIKLHDTLHRNQVLASLDVESLFTNVPVETTIDIIIATAYNHHSLPPPQIDADVMRQLLKICTTATPFFVQRHQLRSKGRSIHGLSTRSYLRGFLHVTCRKLFAISKQSI